MDCDTVNSCRWKPTFWKNILREISDLNFNPEDGGRIFFQSFVSTCKTTTCHSQEDHSLIHLESLFDVGRSDSFYWKINEFRHVQLIVVTHNFNPLYIDYSCTALKAWTFIFTKDITWPYSSSGLVCLICILPLTAFYWNKSYTSKGSRVKCMYAVYGNTSSPTHTHTHADETS
jgi:hypothetical protein